MHWRCGALNKQASALTNLVDRKAAKLLKLAGQIQKVVNGAFRMN